MLSSPRSHAPGGAVPRSRCPSHECLRGYKKCTVKVHFSDKKLSPKAGFPSVLIAIFVTQTECLTPLCLMSCDKLLRFGLLITTICDNYYYNSAYLLLQFLSNDATIFTKKGSKIVVFLLPFRCVIVLFGDA